MTWNGWWTASSFFGVTSLALAWSAPRFAASDPLSVASFGCALAALACAVLARVPARRPATEGG